MRLLQRHDIWPQHAAGRGRVVHHQRQFLCHLHRVRKRNALCDRQCQQRRRGADPFDDRNGDSAGGSVYNQRANRPHRGAGNRQRNGDGNAAQSRQRSTPSQHQQLGVFRERPQQVWNREQYMQRHGVGGRKLHDRCQLLAANLRLLCGQSYGAGRLRRSAHRQ